ncbi:MAG: DUF5054 domain-containing protein [Boseongicola sp. SB0670_bin_30]|nr:DUF5054 domain-containing protein [Boseongicola sp. SB0670_bin_30]
MARRKVHLVFKTHLDVGFTDYAAGVRQQYHDHFIPMAIRTAKHFWHEDPDSPKFIWTAGAWLIHEHLEQATTEGRRKLEDAIENGTITWHALPYTTHTELLSAELFKAGLGFSRDLDRRFGRATTGAKLTDVPGHTLGIVPLMAAAGIRFLHIGVNSASTPPDVPPVFRWRATGGEELVVMYQSEYGATYFPGEMDEGIGFGHATDNMGPQSIAQVVETHRLMARDNPGTIIAASTLNEYGDLLWKQRERFPVVTDEIADSWIHGVGTAPTKMSRYLALRRLYGKWAREGLTPQREAMGRRLCMVAEHTWGVDIKTFLRDEAAWDRQDFETARQFDSRFALTERSWREQEALIDDAISVLAREDREEAERAATPSCLQPTATAVRKRGSLTLGDGKLDFDKATGGLIRVRFPNGCDLESAEGQLAALTYESYDAQDYHDYAESYLTQFAYWSVRDHGKPGLEHSCTARSGIFEPKWMGVAMEGGSHAIGKFQFSETAADDLGAPGAPEIRYRFIDRDTLEVTVCLFDKPANRMPEASFVTFAPTVDPGSWRFRKLDYDVDPRAVVKNGNRQLHAVQSVSCMTSDSQHLRIAPLDCPLAGPAEAPFLPFFRGVIAMRRGVRFCLHNNKWGTNFPMWCEGNFAYRFRMSLSCAR